MDCWIGKIFLAGTIVVTFSAQALPFVGCSDEDRYVRNTKEDIGSLLGANSALAAAIEASRASIAGPLKNVEEDAANNLSAFGKSIKALSSNKKLIREMKTVLEALLANEGQMHELTRALAAYIYAQPEIPLSQAFALSLESIKFKLDKQSLKDVTNLIEELRILESSSTEWLNGFMELLKARPVMAESALLGLLQSVLQVESESADALMQDRALQKAWEIKLAQAKASSAAAEQDILNKQGQIAVNQQRIGDLQRSLPSLIASLQRCVDRGWRKFDEAPK